jgi:hypothetical protein
MERVYLGLAIVGFLVPNTVTLIESVQTGNILFWADPARTTAELFANRTSAAFALDLFATVRRCIDLDDPGSTPGGDQAGVAILGADAAVRAWRRIAAVSLPP